jgi:hypothetical protein
LGDRTLLYLDTDDDGSGPWIYTMEVERAVAANRDGEPHLFKARSAAAHQFCS